MASIKKGSFILFLVIVTAFLLPAALFAGDVIAYIGEVGGEVKVIKANPGKELSAKLGMLLGTGDTVKTAEESYTSIIFQDDGSRIKLGESSQLTLNATRKKKKLNKRMYLSAGKLWAKVTKKRGTDLQVSTPTSVASVKGTKFVIEESNNPGVTWVWVLEDIVELSSPGGKVMLHQGQWGKATKDGIETEDIKDGDVPVEPGEHELIFYFRHENEGSIQQKELHIEFEN